MVRSGPLLAYWTCALLTVTVSMDGWDAVVLGLTMEATDAEIKKAYRKLSLKYHPGASRAFSWVVVYGTGECVDSRSHRSVHCVCVDGCRQERRRR